MSKPISKKEEEIMKTLFML